MIDAVDKIGRSTSRRRPRLQLRCSLHTEARSHSPRAPPKRAREADPAPGGAALRPPNTTPVRLPGGAAQRPPSAKARAKAFDGHPFCSRLRRNEQALRRARRIRHRTTVLARARGTPPNVRPPRAPRPVHTKPQTSDPAPHPPPPRTSATGASMRGDTADRARERLSRTREARPCPLRARSDRARAAGSSAAPGYNTFARVMFARSFVVRWSIVGR